MGFSRQVGCHLLLHKQVEQVLNNVARRSHGGKGSQKQNWPSYAFLLVSSRALRWHLPKNPTKTVGFTTLTCFLHSVLSFFSQGPHVLALLLLNSYPGSSAPHQGKGLHLLCPNLRYCSRSSMSSFPKSSPGQLIPETWQSSASFDPIFKVPCPVSPFPEFLRPEHHPQDPIKGMGHALPRTRFRRDLYLHPGVTPILQAPRRESQEPLPL